MRTNQYLLREAKSIVVKPLCVVAEVTIDAPTLFILSEGCGSMRINATLFEFSFGTLLFAHAGSKVEINNTAHSDIHVNTIQFDQYKRILDEREQLQYHIDEEGLPDNGVVGTLRFRAVLTCSKELIAVHSQSDVSSHSFEEQLLLLELLQEVLIRGSQIRSYAQETPIQKATRYIKDNYNTPIKRSFLAQLTGYHPHYLSKQFHAETGQSISDFILQLRVEKAKELLSITNSPINEIAAVVGYQDALYFSRKFKQATHTYPTEFRQKPKRVVAFQYVGTLLALGIKPVGVESDLIHYSQQLKGELAGIPSFEDWDHNRVRILQPDIIVAPSYLRKEQLQQLRAIAPVIDQSWEGISPIERVQMMGKLLGKQQEAQRWIMEFSQMTEKQKHKLAQVWPEKETVAAYEIADGHVYVIGKHDRGAYALYDVLGLQPPEAVRNLLINGQASKRIDRSELKASAADHMIVSTYEEGGTELTSRLLESEEWRELPAVRNNRVHLISVHKCFSNDGVSLQKLTTLLMQLLLHNKMKK